MDGRALPRYRGAMHLSDDQLQTLRQKLSARGREINDKILALQSGKSLPPSETDVPSPSPARSPSRG